MDELIWLQIEWYDFELWEEIDFRLMALMSSL